MIAVAVVLVGVSCLADRVRPAVVVGLLDTALDRVWSAPDVQPGVVELLGWVAVTDPTAVGPRVRAAADRLATLPPGRYSGFAGLAAVVAPHDRGLRDELLRSAAAEARAALAVLALWQGRAVRMPGEFVAQQAERDWEKQRLTFTGRLAEAVVARDLSAVGELLVEAEAAGSFGACVRQSYAGDVLTTLAHLTPELLLDPALPLAFDGWDDKSLPRFCGEQAYHRWLNGRRDRITGELVTFAVRNGVTARHVFEVFAHFDLPAAWAAAERLPDDANDPGFPRLGPLSELIAPYARRDLDAALAAAERQADPYTRRELLTEVAWVWAAWRPATIERAIQNQDNELRRTWARDAAAAELAHRAQGLPPGQERSPRQQKRAMGKQPLPPAVPANATDEELQRAAWATAHAGDVLTAVELARRVRELERFVIAACGVARELCRAAEER